MRRLRLSRFLWIPIILVLVGTASGLALWLASGPDDWKGLALNLATELVGAAVTYILLVLILERTEDVESERERLINDMRSSVSNVAKSAAGTLAQHGWLMDGSLNEADLHGANLKGAYLRRANLVRTNLVGTSLVRAELWMANLEGANLLGANLEGADLVGANLAGTNLSRSILRGAWLNKANLEGADLNWADLAWATLQEANLRDAVFNRHTTLPDRTKWRLDTDLARFTDPDHPDFWRSDCPNSPAYRGKDDD